MKVVINNCYGGFGLSDEGIEHYAKLKGIELDKRDSPYAFGSKYEYYIARNNDNFRDIDIHRDDPALVQTVKDLGKESHGFCAHLKVVTIPDDVEWEIAEYDGNEWVAEKHRTWE